MIFNTVFPKFNITESMKWAHNIRNEELFGKFLYGLEIHVCCETPLKNCSLCSQAGPSRTSEIDEKTAPGKSYTGRSFAFLTSVLEIQCVSFAFHSFATWFAIKLRVLELKHE